MEPPPATAFDHWLTAVTTRLRETLLADAPETAIDSLVNYLRVGCVILSPEQDVRKPSSGGFAAVADNSQP